MRRSRFAKAIEVNEIRERASVGDAMTFDIVAHETADEEALCEWRSDRDAACAAGLGVTHLLIAIACVVLSSSLSYPSLTDNPLVPAVLVLLLDLGMAALLLKRHRLNLAPHTVFRFLCVYLAVAGILSTWFGHAVSDDAFVMPIAAAPIAMAAGIAMRSVVAVNSPPLAFVNLIVSTAAASVLATSPLVPAGVAVLSIRAVRLQRRRGAEASSRRGASGFALEAQARKSQHFVEEFESSGRGWFWETDPAGTLSYVSRQLAEDFQCEPEELLGRQFTDLLSVETEASDCRRRAQDARLPPVRALPLLGRRRPASERGGRPLVAFGQPDLRRARPLPRLPRHRHGPYRAAPVGAGDHAGLRGSIRSPACPNRAMMRQTLDEALRNAAHRQKGCALFMIDLDRFKNVNDTLGHPIGDALLRQVADRLKSVMGNHGQVGRLGGDEFQAVFPGTVDIGLLESLSRTLIEQVSRPYTIEGHKVTIGASVGIAIGDPGRASADAMVRNADLALYAAKAAGRGKHRLYEPSMHSEAADRQLMENDLRQAIERGELAVHYQPIVRAAGEEISGFESLVRWQHPTRGAISPAKFIPLAEEAGLIGEIGEWVLRTALEEAAHWPDHVRVAVNLSPLQFNDPAVVEMVSNHLSETGVRAERLELEITEGVFLAEGDSTDETFAKLKALGVRLALDDFGTGYSSLGYLKKAPFDKIKIDQSFVRGAASTTQRNAAIIRAIVTPCRHAWHGHLRRGRRNP